MPGVPDRVAKFSPGQLIRHRLFGYRGVVADVDPHFSLSQDWYDQVARSRPPKDLPWYRVLVHGSDQHPYVAERNLEADESAEPIDHPEIARHFQGLSDGRYRLRDSLN